MQLVRPVIGVVRLRYALLLTRPQISLHPSGISNYGNSCRYRQKLHRILYYYRSN